MIPFWNWRETLLWQKLSAANNAAVTSLLRRWLKTDNSFVGGRGHLISVEWLLPQTCPHSSEGVVPPQRQMQRNPTWQQTLQSIQPFNYQSIGLFQTVFDILLPWMANMNVHRPFLKSSLFSSTLNPVTEVSSEWVLKVGRRLAQMGDKRTNER